MHSRCTFTIFRGSCWRLTAWNCWCLREEFIATINRFARNEIWSHQLTHHYQLLFDHRQWYADSKRVFVSFILERWIWDFDQFICICLSCNLQSRWSIQINLSHLEGDEFPLEFPEFVHLSQSAPHDHSTCSFMIKNMGNGSRPGQWQYHIIMDMLAMRVDLASDSAMLLWT